MTMIRGYVGIPFVDRGRSFEGCDCFGLVRLVFDRVAGVTLPSYDWISSEDMRTVARQLQAEAASGRWRQLADKETPRTFDVAAMVRAPQPGARAWHCGVMAGPGTLLHTERGAGSHLAGIHLPEIAPRIECFFRHIELEARHG